MASSKWSSGGDMEQTRDKKVNDNNNNNNDKCEAASGGEVRHSDSDDEFLYLVLSCCDCDDLFPTQKQLLLHRLEAHADRRPHQCPACMVTFGAADLLRQHAKTHTKVVGQEPEFRCPECVGLVFQSAAKLSCHMRCHSAERPHACQVCSKTFRYRSSLTRHTKKQHPLPEDA